MILRPPLRRYRRIGDRDQGRHVSRRDSLRSAMGYRLMVMRSADDSDAISKRVAELRREEADRLNASCDCPDDVREDDSRVKVHQPGCQHYTAPALAPLQQQRMPDDYWRTLKEQAQCPGAAFLGHVIRVYNPQDKTQWVDVRRSSWNGR